jgi:choline monooxygenase
MTAPLEQMATAFDLGDVARMKAANADRKSEGKYMSSNLQDKVRLFNAELPLERAHTIPSLWYFDPEIEAAEVRTVFASTWQVAGRLDQLAKAGSFFTTNIAGEPILVVRDSAGVIRAFHNVCRHRAAQVVNEASGTASRFRCRYHGWTYDLSGRLRGTPEFEGVADFCREEQGLFPLAVDTWGPLVWVRQARSSSGHFACPSLREFLAPLPDREEDLALENLRFVARRSYDLACNWKVFVDNYLDGGYHLNTVHPGLAGILDYAHYRTEIWDYTSLQSSPLRGSGKDESGQSPAQVRRGAAAYYWWVFPNFMMNVYREVMDTNLVLPLGPDRCRVIFDFYFAHPEARSFIAQSMAVADEIQREDIGICEEVQKGLASRSYQTGRFSVRREAAGYHFHRLLARQLLEEVEKDHK